MDDLTRQIKALEELLVQPHTRADEAVLNTLLHDEFEELGSSGKIVNKQQAIDWLLREADGVQWSLSDFRVKPLADGLVLATYVATKTDSIQQSAKRSLRSSLWKRTASSWSLLFHQGTNINP